MEIKISLDKYADIPFIKKLLSQIKGVRDVEISEDNMIYSWMRLRILKISEKSSSKVEIKLKTENMRNFQTN